MLCPKCGFDNPEAFAFCGRCGSPTGSGTASHGAEARAERRQLTVMFCDLVGSTALSARLDPEELFDLTQEYQRVCAEVIERHEGQIAQFLGDGMLVYFGYPVSHEDDAQRAVHAGLEIIRVISQVSARLRQNLQVRIGVHTGLVVVGQLGGGANPDPMAVAGETPNIAARLQAIAEPGTIVVSNTTYRLIEGFFVCRGHGAPILKGVISPLQVYSVLRETGIRTRFEQAIVKGLTRFVGRETEVELLLRCWDQAAAGRGQVVMLSGEAGIGKSRLVQALKERTSSPSITELKCRCSPYYQNSALYPAIELLERILRFNRNDDSASKLAKLEQALQRDSFNLPELLPLFAALLSLPIGDRYPALTLTPQQQKQQSFEAIIAWLLKTAEGGPLRLTIEDLHWADPSTLELIELLIERISGAQFLMILAFRPEFVPPWSSLSHVTSISLARLSALTTRSLIQAVAGTKSLPANLVDLIVAKTEGTPLFVEELTRMVLESGLLQEQERDYVLSSPLRSLAIPSTLYDSLMARLDRLGTAKEVAQLAAAIGKEFSYELLRAIYPLSETKLTGALNRLIDAELLDQKLSQSRLLYAFRHALIRDAAYESLLRSQRREYHRKLAEVLQQDFPETVEAQPELVANHFTEAGLIGRAIPYWQRAGQRALERSANTEAIHLFGVGLELLKKLPESAERDSQELQLYLGYLPALNVSRSWSAAETGAAYERARDLCERLGETSRIFRMLLGLSVFHQGRGELRRAHEIAVQVHDLASRSDQPSLRLSASWVLGVTLYYLGELVEAHEHLAKGVGFGDHDNGRSQGRHNSRIDCLSVDAEVTWMLGFPDQSQTIAGEALTLARKLGRAYDLALALTHAHMLSFFRGDYEQAIAFADEGLRLCATKNFGFLETALGWSRDCTRIHMGTEPDIEVPRRALAAYNELGTNLHMPVNYMFLARCFGTLGRPDLGLGSVNQAFPLIETTAQRNWEPETWRVKGDLILQQLTLHPRPAAENGRAQSDAQECFRNAIEIARRQESKLFELRATMSLARLLTTGDRCEEARLAIAEIYGWFTEGFDSADLKRAKALLDELSC